MMLISKLFALILLAESSSSIDIPVFTSLPPSQIILSGQQVVLNCAASSSKSISYQWLFNGKLLRKVQNLQLDSGKSMVGNYSCLVSNSFGSVVSRISEVKWPTFSFSKKDVNLKINEGQMMSLNVPRIYKSVPAIERYQWYHQYDDDDDDDDYAFDSKTSWKIVDEKLYAIDGSLFKPITTKRDKGVYKLCVKQYKSWKVIALFKVDITGHQKQRCPHPVISFHRVIALHSNAYVGEKVVAECLAASKLCSYPLTIQWYFHKQMVSPNRTLVIWQSKLSDSGDYSCKATTQGDVKTWNLPITVKARPKIKVIAIKSMVANSKATSVTLLGPELTSKEGLKSVHWYFDGMKVSSSRFQITQQHQLVIKPLRIIDAGIYQVRFQFSGFELVDNTSLSFSNVLPPPVTSSSTLIAKSTSTQLPYQSLFIFSSQSSLGFSLVTNLTVPKQTSRSKSEHTTLIASVAVLTLLVFIGLFVCLLIRRRSKGKTDKPVLFDKQKDVVKAVDHGIANNTFEQNDYLSPIENQYTHQNNTYAHVDDMTSRTNPLHDSEAMYKTLDMEPTYHVLHNDQTNLKQPLQDYSVLSETVSPQESAVLSPQEYVSLRENLSPQEYAALTTRSPQVYAILENDLSPQEYAPLKGTDSPQEYFRLVKSRPFLNKNKT